MNRRGFLSSLSLLAVIFTCALVLAASAQKTPLHLEPVCDTNPMPLECASDPFPETLANRREQVARLRRMIADQDATIRRQNLLLDLQQWQLTLCDQVMRGVEDMLETVKKK